ncbi:MAG: aminopeptidase P family protein [Planctomycetes bacterium]|nr:aminopeptidase P family protein [Planctomycetota bacterium]
MNKEVINRRIQDIRSEARRKKVGVLLLTHPANVTYATGFQGEDSWAVIGRRQVTLLTDCRYSEQAAQECPACRIRERQGSMPQLLAAVLGKAGSPATLAVEDSISVANLKRIAKQWKRRIKSASGLVEGVRQCKEKEEIRKIKKAIKIAAQALEQTLPHIKPGIRETALAGFLDYQIRLLGGSNSFATIVAFGANGSRPHHRPGNRTLKSRDSLLIDFGARYQGYCSDMTRCFSVGKPTQLFQKAYDTVQKAQEAALRSIAAGVRLAEVDDAARGLIRTSGMPVYGHGTGHGIGLDIHEAPFLGPDGEATLKTHQVITIEPGIYIPGKLGIRLEEDVQVLENGRKILTRKCAPSWNLG